MGEAARAYAVVDSAMGIAPLVNGFCPSQKNGEDSWRALRQELLVELTRICKCPRAAASDIGGNLQIFYYKIKFKKFLENFCFKRMYLYKCMGKRIPKSI